MSSAEWSARIRACQLPSYLASDAIDILATKNEEIDLAHCFRFASIEAGAECLGALNSASIDAIAAGSRRRALAFGGTAYRAIFAVMEHRLGQIGAVSADGIPVAPCRGKSFLGLVAPAS